MWEVGDKWGYFAAVNGRSVAPFIDVFHSECFNASVIEGARAEFWPRPGQTAAPLQLIKNIHNMAPMFMAGSTRLIVNRQVKELLTNFAKVQFLPAEIGIAWDYHYEPGSLAYLEDDAFDRQRSLDLDWSSFIDKYRVDPPKVELYEVVDYGYRITDYEFRDDPGKYIDRKDYYLPGTMDGRSGGHCLVSKIMLEEAGLYHSWGTICAPGLLDMLRPFLRPDFWWIGTLPF